MNSSNTQNFSDKPLRQLGRDEMNLAEFPIALLTDRVPKDQKEAVYQDEIFDERTGRTLSRKLTISAGNHGLTTAIDDQVILSLIQLTRQKNNFTNSKVEFSRHELIQLLGWSTGGASYERILLSMQKWTSVYLQYENAWRDNRDKVWTTKGFHIIESFELNDSRSSGEQLDLIPSHIVWGAEIFDSFQAGYLKPLDYDLCMGLSNSTAKRMYRFLDKRFHHKPEWTFDLKEFAHGHIGLGHHYEGPAHLKRNLQPAIAELEKVNFLEPLPPHERFPKDGKNWKIRLLQKAASSPPLPLPEASPVVEASPLSDELVKRGVTDTTAAELVQRYPAERIGTQIEVFDWLIERQEKRLAKNPAGYLVKSITTGENGYAIPKGFIPKAERLRQAEARQAKQQQAAEERRREQDQEAKAREDRRKIEAHWNAMTPHEQEAFDLAAQAEADAETLELLKSPMKAVGMRLIRDQHIVKLLRQRGELPPVGQ